MCWKSHVQDSQPTAMPTLVSTEDSQNIGNITQGGTGCPDEATACSNITSSTIECYKGFCCVHNGQPLCSCFPGWEPPACDIETYKPFESLLKEGGAHHWLIGVVIGVLLVGLLIVAFFVYRKRTSRNNSSRSSDRASATHGGGKRASASLIGKNQPTNGNDKELTC